MTPKDWDAYSDEAILREIGSQENRDDAVSVMNELTVDPLWTPIVIDLLRGFDKQGQPIVEVRGLLKWLSRQIEPRDYLEIGVRRGFSAAMVAATAPCVDIYAFDMWVPNYANVDNPGPDFVSGELLRVGHRGERFFFNGDSRVTVPDFLRRRPPMAAWGRMRSYFGLHRVPKGKRPPEFDLILVDGDHSVVGAYEDLKNVMRQCRVGGVVAFDDIAPQPISSEALKATMGDDPNGHVNLYGVWKAIKREHPTFRYVEYTGHWPGIAIAIRME